AARAGYRARSFDLLRHCCRSWWDVRTGAARRSGCDISHRPAAGERARPGTDVMNVVSTQSPPDVSASNTSTTPPGASPIRLLIAEDEANLGMILEQFMTARGFAVTMVRDGRAALEQLRSDRFDVALLDIVMPEMDGLEV